MSPKGMMLGGYILAVLPRLLRRSAARYDGQRSEGRLNRQLSPTGIMPESLPGKAVDASSCYFREWYHAATCRSRCAGSGGSGAFRGNDIGMQARAAAQMERFGQSVSDTINQFQRLKDDPVNAAKLALDNELHFLPPLSLSRYASWGAGTVQRCCTDSHVRTGRNRYARGY